MARDEREKGREYVPWLEVCSLMSKLQSDNKSRVSIYPGALSCPMFFDLISANTCVFPWYLARSNSKDKDVCDEVKP